MLGKVLGLALDSVSGKLIAFSDSLINTHNLICWLYLNDISSYNVLNTIPFSFHDSLIKDIILINNKFASR